MLKVQIDPIERITRVDLQADLSAPEQRLAAAQAAREGLEQAQIINQSVFGRPTAYRTTVDGRENAPLESVNPNGGEIIFDFDLATNVLQWIAQTLIDRSPVDSGAYRSAHELFADGRQVDAHGAVPQAHSYVFLNAVPYARKIEIGKTESGRAFEVQVPNRIYERTAQDARARFANIADITFGYEDGPEGYALKRSVGRRRDRAAGTLVQSPAITVTFER